MKLATFDKGRIGRIVDDTVFDVTDVVMGDGRFMGMSAMRALITRWPEVAPRIADEGRALALDEVTLRAPIPDPTKIVAAPVNYQDHQSEMNVDAHISGLGIFLKASSSILDPGATVQLPYHGRRFDQEGELGLVVGREARRVGEDVALDYVFGYTGLLDITMRGGEDRSTRKSFETFTPMGPWLVTPEEFGPPDDVDLRCWVSGELRQDANTQDLIWGAAKLLSYASWVTTLKPGDVIATGTPAGVGPIRAGDTIELELSNLGGRLTVGVDDSEATEPHTLGHRRGPKPPPAPSRGG